jgi:hypothetical protein
LRLSGDLRGYRQPRSLAVKHIEAGLGNPDWLPEIDAIAVVPA